MTPRGWGKTRPLTVRPPSSARPRDLAPGEVRRVLTAVHGEDKEAALKRGKVMPWGKAIVGRPTLCSRIGGNAVWVFAVTEARIEPRGQTP